MIEQKFLESGQTQIEVDSMHSCIEQAKKENHCFPPRPMVYCRFIGKKEKVVQMRYNEFYDLKKLAGHLLHNVKKDINGETVHWMKIKNLKFEKDALHLIKYRYGFDEEFQVLRVSASGRRKGREVNLESRYSAQIKISAAKRTDLINLCDTHVIPEPFHSYYHDLPYEASKTTDCDGNSDDDNGQMHIPED